MDGLGNDFVIFDNRKKIKDFEIYKEQLKQRLDPSVAILQGINSQIKKTQKKYL